ncbi:MAG: sigma factor-like helix-turn-helix DNA-binding protein [Rhodothermales bacterium]|nr:sigma factor-like helix-turn-helix DNA-binding protein [Rhodothermales bacterium]
MSANPRESPDEVLVVAAILGDLRAFDELALRYRPAVLRLVPADYAEVLRLRFLDDTPLRRIASFLDIPVSTVKWRVHRGRTLLKEALARLDPE